MTFLSQLTNTKLKLVTFVIFPIIILILGGLGVYNILNQSKQTQTIDEIVGQIEKDIGQSSTDLVTESNGINSSTSTNSNSPKTSFDDLSPSSKIAKNNSSSITLTSPVASTPAVDIKEIGELVEAVELDDNTKDQELDEQLAKN
jgi:hypothetical protein